MKKSLTVNLDENSYNIVFTHDNLDDIAKEINTVYNGEKIAVITDKNVYDIYGNKIKYLLESSGYKVYYIILRSGEASKSFDSLERIYKELVEHEIIRTDLIMALGGGVVGDIAGFAASTYLRGIPYIQVPTTLLAQVDSSVGGKTAINLSLGKNLVGSFYQPLLVYIDTVFLDTLEDKYVKDGMAEVIKYACIEDREFFDYLNSIDVDRLSDSFEQIVYKCCNIKKQYVEEDERDIGLRMKLNFGHTIGHAIEKYFNYEKYTHGEAVAMGMYNITVESEENGYTEGETCEKIKNILLKYGLDYKLPDMDEKKLRKIIKNDKKNMSERLNLIYLKKIGEANIVNKFILN